MNSSDNQYVSLEPPLNVLWPQIPSAAGRFLILVQSLLILIQIQFEIVVMVPCGLSEDCTLIHRQCVVKLFLEQLKSFPKLFLPWDPTSKSPCISQLGVSSYKVHPVRASLNQLLELNKDPDIVDSSAPTYPLITNVFTLLLLPSEFCLRICRLAPLDSWNELHN